MNEYYYQKEKTFSLSFQSKSIFIYGEYSKLEQGDRQIILN